MHPWLFSCCSATALRCMPCRLQGCSSSHINRRRHSIAPAFEYCQYGDGAADGAACGARGENCSKTFAATPAACKAWHCQPMCLSHASSLQGMALPRLRASAAAALLRVVVLQLQVIELPTFLEAPTGRFILDCMPCVSLVICLPTVSGPLAAQHRA